NHLFNLSSLSRPASSSRIPANFSRTPAGFSRTPASFSPRSDGVSLMPRKSANEVAIESVAVGVVSFNHDRPDPPAGMPEVEAAIWRAVVSAMRPGWFSRETHEQLARYCYAMVEAARLEAEIVRVGVGSPDYDQLSKRRNATAASALSYARALRITPHSNK